MKVSRLLALLVLLCAASAEAQLITVNEWERIQMKAAIPECELHVSEGAATIFMVAIYAHEATAGVRYTFTTPSMVIEPGEVATPCPCEGYPIGFEWYLVPPIFNKSTPTLIKGCGDTGRVYPHIFSDGFESGDTSRWTETYVAPPDHIFSDGFEFGDTTRWSETVGGA